MQDFKDKVALITGASSGIGRALALRMAKLGARLALVARNREALDELAAIIEKAGSQALVISADVTEEVQCRAAVEQAAAHFGKLDIVVCSAGLSMRTYLERSDPLAMERVVRVNFLGTLFITHAAIPHVRKTRGSLVALSSLTGLRGVPSYSLYGATKFAIQGLYESLRHELRQDGVHVGVVAPGFVDTPLRSSVLGPGGRPWSEPPKPPFRVWPVEKCVDRIVHLIRRRKRQANLPWFIGPLFWLDRIVAGMVGDVILRWRFPPL
jgi:NAD(P)-dependent dehydrogenase (short-subunit alcohol dehydrogenase family)